VEGLREPTVLQDLFGEANEPIGPDSALAATPALWSHPSHPAQPGERAQQKLPRG
jgi:hypothetical protein